MPMFRGSLSRLGRRAAAAGLLAALLVPLAAPAAHAADYASMDEAKAMAQRAAQLVRDKGLDGAAPAFLQNPGPFRDRDLYVFVWNKAGQIVTHPATPGLVGRNMIDMKDVTGFPIGRSIVAVKDEAWVEYRWPNPQTKAIEQKASYIIAVGDTLIGVGAYKAN